MGGGGLFSITHYLYMLLKISKVVKSYLQNEFKDVICGLIAWKVYGFTPNIRLRISATAHIINNIYHSKPVHLFKIL